MRNNLLINSHLDYLTVSFDRIEKPEQLFPKAMDWAFAVVEEMPPLPNYNTGYRLECGAFLNLSKSDVQGARLDLSGVPLAFLHREGITDEMLMKFLGASGLMKRTTRADYCFNIMGGGSIRHILTHYAKGYVDSHFRTDPVVKHGTPDLRGGISPKGATVEFGSEKSEQRIAIYDKAADLKLLHTAWLRVELRTRKPVSTNFMADAAKHGYPAAARWRLAKLLNYPRLHWWRKMMEGDNCPVSLTHSKPEKWRQWLDNQVKGSIKKHLQYKRDREFIECWLASIAEMVHEYDDEIDE